MLKYTDLTNLALNKYPIELPVMPKNKGMVIILNNKTLDANIKIIKNKRMFKNINLVKSYFKEKKYNLKVIGQVTDKYDVLDDYEKIRTNSQVTKLYSRIEAYKQNNLFFDLGHFNELFIASTEKHDSQAGTRLSIYMDILKNIDTKYLVGYTKKLMIIDLEDWSNNVKDSAEYRLKNADTPFEYIFASISRNIEEFKKFPMEILFIYKRYSIKVVPSECDDKTKNLLRAHLSRIKEDIVGKQDESPNISEEDNKASISKTVDPNISEKTYDAKSKVLDDIRTKMDVNSSFSFTGEFGDELDEKVKKTIEDVADKKAKEIDDKNLSEEETEKEIKESIDDELKKSGALEALELAKMEKITGMSQVNLKRNKILAKRQAEIKVNNQGDTLETILKELDDKTIKPKELKNVNVQNNRLKSLRLPNMTREYNKKLLEKDTLGIIHFLSEQQIPAYVLDIKKEDTSDSFNKKYTYKIKLETSDRLRHTLVFDMPKFVDDSFMYLGGNKKTIVNQLFLKPVVKTGPDTVQLCTNYNKIFLTRTGTKVSPKTERIRKYFSDFGSETNKNAQLYYKKGDNTVANVEYKTTIEYDELASMYMSLQLFKGSYKFFFNQNNFRDQLNSNKIKFIDNDDDIIPIGIKDNKEILHLDTTTNKIKGTDLYLLDFIIEAISEKIPTFKDELAKITTGKRFIYTQAKIMAKDVPLILLLSYSEGFIPTLTKAGIKYKVMDKRSSIDKNNQGIIEFEDCFLVFDRYPYKNSLLLNGLTIVPTKMYKLEDMNKKDTYLDIFENLYNDRRVLNAFENFYGLFIDPITREVLKDLALPQEYSELLIYANSLLEDNQFIPEKNMISYRIRNNEIVNAYLYKSIANAYSRYRSTVGNRNPEKISIPQDDVLKGILTSNVVEDYSTLNPVLEVEKLRAVSFKGPSGLNQERAYTVDKRAYDPSMRGIISMSTPPSGNVGIMKYLSLDSNILSTRGYMKIIDDKNLKDMDMANTFSPSELLTTLAPERDDALRVSMATTQSKHVVPVKKYDQLLMGTGMDKILANVISNDFAFKAKQDGEVEDIDEKCKLMTVKYKDGTKDIIDLRENVSKNGGGGFYISNKLVTDFKPKQKFKENDILAFNDKFFNRDGKASAVFKVGTLSKIALVSGDITYEDSAALSSKLAHDMAAEVIMPKQVVLGKNSNIEFCVKPGDSVEVGDPLLIFDQSYDDEGLNKMLANLDKDLQSDITKLGKTPIKTKYSGVIHDVKIYTGTDIKDLSPSIQKLFKSITSKTKETEKYITKQLDLKDTNITLDPTDKVETKYGKIKGTDVGDGVLIEFYVRYNDIVGVGDKITFFTALKATVSQTFPEGREPYSEFRPNEHVDSFLGPISYLARMTGSVITNMFSNKLIIELKRKCEEIYNE